MKFIGRKFELETLNDLLKKDTASFVVVKGRRRIGKSRLIKEYSKSFSNFYSFSGLAPEKTTTNVHQIEEFSRQMSQAFHTAPALYADWSDAFWALAERVKKGRTLILFDEISWMGSKDPTFLGKIKNLWDLHLKQNNHLVFVICGSAASWIDEYILKSTGFLGRISYTLTLKELSLGECASFWDDLISPYEKFKVLSVTGGIPKYLEEINPKETAELNLKKLCFTEGGLLVREFDQIFADIFTKNSGYYKKIIEALVAEGRDLKGLRDILGEEHNGRLPEYLEELQQLGFVTRDFTWSIKSGKDSKLSHYRIIDNYTRFYLKYIKEDLAKIQRGSYVMKSLTALPGWDSIMGYQFETMMLNNRKYIYDALKISPDEVIVDNPFFQRKTTKYPGCQIDYMIQTKHNTLYVCEIKFSRHEIHCDVIEDVKRKINALKYPKGFSIRPVLIHVNGVGEDVMDSDYFSNIIDAGDFFKAP